MFFPRHAPASSRTSFSNISPGTKFAGQVNRPLTPEHFAKFEKCYGADPNGRAKRKPSDSKEDRWRSFSIDEVKNREFKIDSLKWLKDDALDDGDGLLEPEELATDAIAELQAAVEELTTIITLLEDGSEENVAGKPATEKSALV
jgi:type I restriction enzyme M protein